MTDLKKNILENISQLRAWAKQSEKSPDEATKGLSLLVQIIQDSKDLIQKIRESSSSLDVNMDNIGHLNDFVNNQKRLYSKLIDLFSKIKAAPQNSPVDIEDDLVGIEASLEEFTNQVKVD